MHFRWFHGFHVHVAPIVDPVDEEAVRETWWKVVKSGVVNPKKNERFGVPQALREKEQQGNTHNSCDTLSWHTEQQESSMLCHFMYPICNNKLICELPVRTESCFESQD